MLPFLDVSVENTPTSILTSVYKKPTFTGLRLSWDSFSPKSRKISIVKTHHREVMRYSECKLDLELREIANIFLARVSPESVIKANI